MDIKSTKQSLWSLIKGWPGILVLFVCSVVAGPILLSKYLPDDRFTEVVGKYIIVVGDKQCKLEL